MLNSPPPVPKLSASASGITCFHPLARPLFERALWRGQLLSLIARFTRRERRLQSLEETIGHKHYGWRNDGNVRPVALDQIRGTVNRSCYFDRDFYPLNELLEDRWVRVASMMLQGQTFPPIELVLFQSAYFVVDGHHRISVARVLRYSTLDAVVMILATW
jgi:hypothetical protein